MVRQFFMINIVRIYYSMLSNFTCRWVFMLKEFWYVNSKVYSNIYFLCNILIHFLLSILFIYLYFCFKNSNKQTKYFYFTFTIMLFTSNDMQINNIMILLFIQNWFSNNIISFFILICPFDKYLYYIVLWRTNL